MTVWLVVYPWRGCRFGLSSIVWGMLLLLGVSAAGMASNCLKSVSPAEPDWVALTSTPHSRELPPISDPRFGWGDWPEDEQGSPQKVSYDDFLTMGPKCATSWVTRYKFWNGTLYTDFPNGKVEFMRSYFVEQLLLAKWLYKDLPENIDLVMNGNDQLGECNASLPVMQYTIFNTTSLVTGEPLNISPGKLVWPLKGHEQKLIPFTHGYTIPYRETWRDLSLSPGQLRAYMGCVQQRYGGGVNTSCPGQPPQAQGTDPWAAARKPQLVWRGSTTGFKRGWPDGVVTSDPFLQHPLGGLMWNKRLFMCVISRPYPFIDVGLGSKKSAATKASKDCEKALTQLFHKPYVSLEAQSSYQLAVSIDGHVGPWRYPQQMLGLTPIVRVDSPYREFFHKWLHPGVHYEPVKLDLSDFVVTTKRLLDEAAVNSTRLQCMASAAANVMLERMHALAQLDSFAWSLSKLRAAYNWEVKSPEEEQQQGLITWYPVRVRFRWISQGLLHLEEPLRAAYPNNYRRHSGRKPLG